MVDKRPKIDNGRNKKYEQDIYANKEKNKVSPIATDPFVQKIIGGGPYPGKCPTGVLDEFFHWDPIFLPINISKKPVIKTMEDLISN